MVTLDKVVQLVQKVYQEKKVQLFKMVQLNKMILTD